MSQYSYNYNYNYGGAAPGAGGNAPQQPPQPPQPAAAGSYYGAYGGNQQQQQQQQQQPATATPSNPKAPVSAATNSNNASSYYEQRTAGYSYNNYQSAGAAAAPAPATASPYASYTTATNNSNSYRAPSASANAPASTSTSYNAAGRSPGSSAPLAPSAGAVPSHGQHQSPLPPAPAYPPANGGQAPYPGGASAPSPYPNPQSPPQVQQQQQQQPYQPPHQEQEEQRRRQPPQPSAAAGRDSGETYARAPPRRAVNLRLTPSPPSILFKEEVMLRGPREYSTSTNNAPLSTTDFVGIDTGNANPKFFRITSDILPSEHTLVKETALPFGAVLSPLCRPLHAQEEVPLVTEHAPIRCMRCRGYLSCHSTFCDMGRAWACNLCGMKNDVEQSYFQNLDESGRRLDRMDRPELCRGSVEYDVDAFPDYNVMTEKGDKIPTRPLHHLFLIDISTTANALFLSDYVHGIAEALRRMAERTPQARVSFITYGTQVHFYNFHHPQMPQLCVPDVEDPFSPLPFKSMCWLEVGSEMECIQTFLSRVPMYAVDAKEPGADCVVGAAVKVATLVLSGMGGGRVVVSAHHFPFRGIGTIKPREQHKLYGTEKEKELLRPMDGFWTSLATDAAKQGISFDLFMFCSEYCELVTMSALSHVTNGRLFLFSKYDPMIDSTKVQAQLQQLMTEEAGYAGILRVRASAGLRVKRYRGHFLSQNSLDMDLASITGSSTFFVEFEHEGSLDKKGYVYFQTALLYTTRTGHRRVRVHSFRQRATPQYSTMFETMDLEAILVGMVQQAVGEAVNKGPQHARQGLTEKLIKMLTTYRRYAAAEETRGSSSTLLMPTRLRLLALYVLCLLRSDALVEGTTVRIDDRVQNIFDLVSMPVHKLLIYLYPSLFAVHQLQEQPRVGTINPTTNEYILPPHEQLILESVVKQGVYVLCDEQARLVYLWIGSRVDPQVSTFLFGVPDAAVVGRAGGPGEDQFDERLRNLLYTLTTRDDGVRRLIVVHEGDTGEESFFKQFKEEKMYNSMGYSEILELLHKTVRNALL